MKGKDSCMGNSRNLWGKGFGIYLAEHVGKGLGKDFKKGNSLLEINSNA